ncbi:anhydro-N-acetylmuramic acid kinase [Asticcacaulis sp. ZE23SCel15]|uniref:anhydro-N-acetylmuramic acid kinase n=1 Tax=Asticcacaulis sp. ZE23SCel15 TaxID=3059027 RepID=UPI00265D9F0C|nr:anhydro-N-acetylmuramic acid kinase [Asticcacaulis sp. ZE23SCel15]WKL56416.1 anhydro-N-acetylmuramic acid kinase [Asticcacaulis sp. ZE23SCel15]
MSGTGVFKVLGFMTGTSLDGIDMAVLETDGEQRLTFGPWAERPMPDAVRAVLQDTVKAALSWPRGTPEPEIFNEARKVITDYHFTSAQAFLAEQGLGFSDFDLLGVHGQTVLHERPKAGVIGRTVQLFDGQAFADMNGVKVVSDFRAADMAAGGEGAPLAPVYHRALVAQAGLDLPVVVVNLGGVANITIIDEAGDISAMDTGPANGLMDQWVQKHGRGHYDAGGVWAALGTADPALVAAYLSHPYFSASAPKSLDRYDFTLAGVDGLGFEDGLATLCEFTLESLLLAIRMSGVAPKAVVLAGGGRQNAYLVNRLRTKLDLRTQLYLSEDLGWRGGAIEAEAFAYMAVRALRSLPISYPTTTGVPQPLTGGRVNIPSAR